MFANDLEDNFNIGDTKKLSAGDTVGVRQRTGRWKLSGGGAVFE